MSQELIELIAYEGIIAGLVKRISDYEETHRALLAAGDEPNETEQLAALDEVRRQRLRAEAGLDQLRGKIESLSEQIGV